MRQLFANNAVSALVGAIGAADGVLAVANGAELPAPLAGEFFLLTLIGLDGNGNESSWEIVKVTMRSGDTLTVQRGQEGTTAKAWADGTLVESRLTAGSMAGLQPLSPNVTALAGLIGAADKLPYFTGNGPMALAVLTAAARTLLAAADQAAQRAAMGLRTGAIADVTTTALDTTASRLLKVGDFGIGEKAALASAYPNFNDMYMSGHFWYPSGTWTNIPAGETFGFLIVAANGANNIGQLFFGGSNKLWYRNRVFAGWSSWRELYHSENVLGTVSQSGGVPTGALIEYGSNAGGEYWRYAGGMQVCRRLTLANTVELGINAPSQTYLKTWILPAAFVADTHCIGECSLGSGAAILRHAVRIQSDMGYSGIAYAIRTDENMPTTSYNYRETLTAIGRWN